MFFCPEKWFFGDTNSNIGPTDIFSIHTIGLPNGLSPATYAFCLGIFVGWIEVVWPNNFSSWIWQKSWSAMWAVVTRVFSAFSAGYCSFNKKEKNSADPEPNHWPEDVLLHFSPPFYQLSFRRVYMPSVWDICWVKRPSMVNSCLFSTAFPLVVL